MPIHWLPGIPIHHNRLSMQVSIIAMDRRQDTGLLKQHLMVSIVDSTFGNYRLLQLVQTAATAVYTHTGPDVTLHGANIDSATWAQDTVGRHMATADLLCPLPSFVGQVAKVIQVTWCYQPSVALTWKKLGWGIVQPGYVITVSQHSIAFCSLKMIPEGGLWNIATNVAVI